ncbi:MAG: hypothetical protein QGF59_07810, partial [Pirellulaceae bacterium]|nr:hypothetical protein [Pirellulaceae bacterium]
MKTLFDGTQVSDDTPTHNKGEKGLYPFTQDELDEYNKAIADHAANLLAEAWVVMRQQRNQRLVDSDKLVNPDQ